VKILVHTLQSGLQYEYLRRLITQSCSADHEIFHIVSSGVKTTKGSSILKTKLLIQKKVFLLALKRKELLAYLANTFLKIFYRSYKSEYDKKKLTYINDYFGAKMKNEGLLDVKIDNVFYIDNINSKRQLIGDIAPDFLLVIGAPFIKRHILELVENKINLHIGYLPQYRGLNSIEWAYLRHDWKRVGYTLHELTEELDKGKIFIRKSYKIEDKIVDFGKIYAKLYEDAFMDIIGIINSRDITATQDVTYEESKIYNNYLFNPYNYRLLLKVAREAQNMGKVKLAIFAGNPVQYHAPIYRLLSRDNYVEPRVLYGSDIGAKRFFSNEFNSFIEWDIPILEGYRYKFFKNFAREDSRGFFSRINPGMFFDILKTRYDAVLIHGYDTVSSWFVFMAAKFAGTKVIWRGEAVKRPSTRKSKIRHFIKAITLPLYFKSYDAVMYSCKANRDYLRQFNIPSENMFSIPCAVDNKFFVGEKNKLTDKRTNIREELNFKPEQFIISFCSRFTPRKKPLDLLEAVKRANNNRIALLFIGDGPERKKMEEFVKRHGLKAVFTGFVGQRELPKYYTAADVLAIISDYDASPKALNEAMNFQLPILATDTVGTSGDLVKNGINGFVVKTGDIDMMAEKINFLADHPNLAMKMGKKSLEIISEWSIEEDVKGIKNAITYVLKKRDNKNVQS